MKPILCSLILFYHVLALSAQSFDHTSGHYFENEGAQIYYEEMGDRESPVLLFLHGGFGNIEDFNGLPPSFSEGYRIIGIDSRGHGKSTLGDRGLTYELLQNDVEALMRFLKIDSLSIIGFSDGGVVAYRLAALSRLNIKQLVTIGARWHFKNGIPMHREWSNLTGEYVRNKFPKFHESYSYLNPTPDFDQFTVALTKMWMDDQSSGHPNEKISAIKSQLLIVRGDTDPFVSRRDIVELSEGVEGSMVFNIPFAWHTAHHDQKEVFVNVVSQFLNQYK